jgi:PPOX class probable F420-dependent enzyme
VAAALSEQDRALFKGNNFAHLTTLNRDGSPQTTVVWVDEAAGEVLMNTTASRVKAANIRRDPRVSVSVHDQANPYASIVVAGRASLDEKGAEAAIDSLAKKFIGKDQYPPEWRGPNERRVTIRVRPERIHRYGY